MIDYLGGATSELVKLALDAALQKHNVIANNIANVNTPGFTPYDLQFETALARLNQKSDLLSDAGMKQQADFMREEIQRGEYVESRGSEKVELDVEMADMAENVLKYRAMLEGLSKRGSIIRMAISGQGR